MIKQRTIAEEIEAAKANSEQMPGWMKRAAYFAYPKIERVREPATSKTVGQATDA